MKVLLAIFVLALLLVSVVAQYRNGYASYDKARYGGYGGGLGYGGYGRGYRSYGSGRGYNNYGSGRGYRSYGRGYGGYGGRYYG